MAQTGYTPILIYSSITASQAPSASNLTNSTLGSELAINITDGKLFYKDNGGSVQVIAWKVTPTSAGGTGLTSYTAGDTLYYATGTTLSKLAIGSSGYYMSSSGTAPQWSAPAALTKTDDTNVTLTLGGSASTALLNAASLTLGWTGQLSASRGGTGIGTYAIGDILYASGTSTLSKLADVTTGNALISGGVGVAPSWGKIALTTHISGVLPVANGGTNASSSSITAFNNITGYTASGATGTTSTNLVFSTSPSITTPTLVGDSTMSTGNLIQGTASKGVNFTANSAAAGMTSQLLNWYEEGTFTPGFTAATSGTITTTDKAGRYTRIGRLVTVEGYINIASVSSPTGDLRLTGFPYAANATTGSSGSVFAYGFAATPTSTAFQAFVQNNQSYAVIRGILNNTQVSNMAPAAQANAGMYFMFTYSV